MGVLLVLLAVTVCLLRRRKLLPKPSIAVAAVLAAAAAAAAAAAFAAQGLQSAVGGGPGCNARGLTGSWPAGGLDGNTPHDRVAPRAHLPTRLAAARVVLLPH